MADPSTTELDCIPFVSSKTALTLKKQYLDTAKVMRIPGWLNAQLLSEAASSGSKLWLDFAVDGFHHIAKGRQSFRKYARPDTKMRIEWMDYYASRPEAHLLGQPSVHAKPDKSAVNAGIAALLDSALSMNVAWVSVPQLPFTDDSERNKINAALASAAADWKKTRKASVELVLPAIFTSRPQTSGKTRWRKKTDQIERCLDRSGASILWVVDTTLEDAKGRPSNPERLTNLLELHKHIRSTVSAQVIAGPYWGFNLVLWSRGLCDYPATGVGSGFQYYIPGLAISRGSNFRIPIAPLKRRAVAGAKLRKWLDASLKRLEANDPIAEHFTALIDGWPRHATQDGARELLCVFYRQWIDELQALKPDARAVSLFQSLSAAYVLGTRLPSLPDTEKPAVAAGQVAEQLMLTCLS